MEKKNLPNISIDDKNFSDQFESCVYVMKCYKDEKGYEEKNGDFLYYTDMTENPMKRLNEHMNLRDTYTKRFKGRVEVSYVELYNDLRSAQKRKDQIKKLRRIDKKTLISKKVAGVCDKCHDKMIKTIMIDNDGQRREILQCTGCKFWKILPISFNH
ncbi:MAG: hypothetical protein GF317_24815 [Candidatus Lokiarchaeota archaeon]|nr:hypothetical protein [Candidatus Lokiarchaeota archaeon]MBD3202584.1 hypothetical protein [Candidatus Lokiarchaeota archaeon]